MGCTKTLKKSRPNTWRQLYYDSVSLTKTAVDHILTTPGSSDAERAAILGATAEKLLTIKPA